MTLNTSSSQVENVRCDYPGCLSRNTHAYLVWFGGFYAFYCYDHHPPLPPFPKEAEPFIRELTGR